MKLGDLEFMPEDFKGIKMPMTNGRITTDIVRLDDALRVINGLLKERLEKYYVRIDMGGLGAVGDFAGLVGKENNPPAISEDPEGL